MKKKFTIGRNKARLVFYHVFSCLFGTWSATLIAAFVLSRGPLSIKAVFDAFLIGSQVVFV
jgi:hypothetical protein